MPSRKQQLTGAFKLLRPQFLLAYTIVGIGGVTFGFVQLQIVPNLFVMLYAFIPLILAAMGVHLRNEAFDWLAGYDREHGGMGVIREGIFSPKQVKIAGTILIIAAFLMAIYQILGNLTLLFVATPMGAVIIYADYIGRQKAGLRELIIASSYWGSFLWIYLGVGWPITAAILVLSIFVFMIVFSLVPYQDIGDYQVDLQSGKTTLVVRLGLDKTGILCIFVALISLFFLYLGVILL